MLHILGLVKHGVKRCHSRDVPPRNVLSEIDVVLEQTCHRSQCANVPLLHTIAVAIGAKVDRGFEFSEVCERPTGDVVDGQEQRKADNHTGCVNHGKDGGFTIRERGKTALPGLALSTWPNRERVINKHASISSRYPVRKKKTNIFVMIFQMIPTPTLIPT